MTLFALAQKQETLSLYTVPTSPIVFVTMNYNLGRYVSALSDDPCLYRLKLISPYTMSYIHRVRKRLYPFFFLGAQCVESGVSCTDCY